MSKSSYIHTRVDAKTKEKVEIILNKLGLSYTDAINIYLHQIILNSGIPFEVKIPQFSKEMEESIKEAEEIMKNPDASPSYNSLEELKEALHNE